MITFVLDPRSIIIRCYILTITLYVVVVVKHYILDPFLFHYSINYSKCARMSLVYMEIFYGRQYFKRIAGE